MSHSITKAAQYNEFVIESTSQSIDAVYPNGPHLATEIAAVNGLEKRLVLLVVLHF